MKRIVVTILFVFITALTAAQDNRVTQIRNHIDTLLADTPGLSERVNVNIKETPLSDFLLAVSEVHKVNISVSPALKQIHIVNNFTDVTVADLLVFLCKEYNLSIEFTGNILAIKPYEAPKEVATEKVVDVGYDESADLLTLNLKGDKLYDAFKRIMDVSGKNLVFAPGMENIPLTVYIKSMPFEAALNKLSFANDLTMSKSRDNFYLFDKLGSATASTAGDRGVSGSMSRPQRSRISNFYFKVLDPEKQLLEVDFENTPVSSIIYDIGADLNIDMFIASPLDNAGTATVKAKNITFDELLSKIFEAAKPITPQGSSYNDASANPAGTQLAGNDSYSFKKQDNRYYFGTKSQLSVRNVKSIHLMHRSIELLPDPEITERSVGRTQTNFMTYGGYDGRGSQQQNQNQVRPVKDETPSESLLSIIPDEAKAGLDIKVDKELNTFLVNGPAENVEKFESYIRYIDKPVPVILIEVMLLEVSRSAVIETGITAGIGDKPVTTKGTVFPTADITMGAQTINKIINRFDGFGSLNIGNVVPDFYLSIKAMEANGDLKIRSSPRLSTLNGHKAHLSIGETTYYVVTNQNYYGSQIPQASEIKNYQPIDAELSVSIKPLVSGDGQITLDIKVIQSSFNGDRIDEDAPPGINSREFTSLIRVRDQDLIVLGGLEEKVKNDSGTGVPLLARIPIIKWFFSSRKREDSRKKLTVLIKPTVIY